MTKGTPGPWGVTTRQGSWDWVVFCEADPNIEICQPFHDGTEENETGEANAHLISAAPDLLVALKRLVADYTWSAGHPNGGFALEHPITAANAAIAKAEGGGK